MEILEKGNYQFPQKICVCAIRNEGRYGSSSSIVVWNSKEFPIGNAFFACVKIHQQKESCWRVELVALRVSKGFACPDFLLLHACSVVENEFALLYSNFYFICVAITMTDWFSVKLIHQ